MDRLGTGISVHFFFRPAMRISLPLTGTLALLALVLAGCAFQPRGALDLPGSVQVRGGSFELRDALQARLAGSGARLAKKDPDLVLTLEPKGFQQRLLSVDPVRGGAREHQVAYRVRYALRDAKGEPVLDPGEVRVVREYRLHPGERLSQNREVVLIHDEMRREAAAAIMRRLYALSARARSGG